MDMKKCPSCNDYTLKNSCKNKNCSCKTKDAHYKHVKIKGGKEKGKA